MPVKLYIVRHGETEWSVSGQHTGSTDIPLTARGEEEAKRLAPWLSGIRFSAALCSPRQRAQRTCELAGLEYLAQVEPDLAEWDYGDYEGICSPEIVKQRPAGGTSLPTAARTASCRTRCRRARIGSSGGLRPSTRTWHYFRTAISPASLRRGG
jgi:broad specificity phosphatase PhoE